MRNSLPYPHEHPGLSRRKWLELAGLGGAGALMSLALSGDTVPEETLPFSEWYYQNIHPVRAEYFPYLFFPTRSPSHSATVAIEDLFRKHAPLQYGSVPRVVHHSFKTELLFLQSELSPKGVGEYADFVQQGVRTFFRWMGIEHLLPDLAFYELRSDTKLEKTTPTHLPVYVVSDCRRRTKGVYRVDAIPNTFVQNFFESIPAVTWLPYYITLDNGNLGVKFNGLNPSFVSLSHGSIPAYLEPFAEVLHFVFSQATLKQLAASFDALRQKRLGTFTEDHRTKLDQEIKKREEGMVHGLVEHYLETHVRELGFSSADLDDYYRDSKFGRARPRYALVPFVQEQLKTTPPHVLVERYFRNNAEIFGPLRI
ncbi:TPA: hypothetical protein HA249_02135 [Candidatus Woesearchaeota archaeon]|nr:hypothetical protein [Candidatus Woesearchaeota archaeon]HII88305.1 hypothetical protein [Candidatus Woesearchaeota archaeon]